MLKCCINFAAALTLKVHVF